MVCVFLHMCVRICVCACNFLSLCVPYYMLHLSHLISVKMQILWGSIPKLVATQMTVVHTQKIETEEKNNDKIECLNQKLDQVE